MSDQGSLSDIGGTEIMALSLDDPCLNGSRVTVFPANCHSSNLVATSDNTVVHQDYWHCSLVLWNTAVRRVVAPAGDTLGAP